MFPVSDVIPSRTRPIVTVSLIAVSTVVFLYQLQLDRGEMYGLARTFGVVPAAAVAWWQPITSAFLHDGWIHFGGSMLYLWIFGENLEDALGHAGFGVFYLSAAAISALTHASLNPSSLAPLIGSSGAIAAILGAYFVLYPRSQILMFAFLILFVDVIEVPAVLFLGVWMVLQLAAELASMGAGGRGRGDDVRRPPHRRWSRDLGGGVLAAEGGAAALGVRLTEVTESTDLKNGETESTKETKKTGSLDGSTRGTSVSLRCLRYSVFKIRYLRRTPVSPIALRYFSSPPHSVTSEPSSDSSPRISLPTRASASMIRSNSRAYSAGAMNAFLICSSSTSAASEARRCSSSTSTFVRRGAPGAGESR